MGRRKVPFTREIYIDESDFEEVQPIGFKRLVLGGEVRLRGSYIIKCEEVIKDSSGKIIELICSADKDTLGKRPEGRKVKGVIHWVSAIYSQAVTLKLYDRLFTAESPDSKEVIDYRKFLNPDSLSVADGCLIEPSVIEGSEIKHFQFEREGYFTIDAVESRGRSLVFNRTITLRDSLRKQVS